MTTSRGPFQDDVFFVLTHDDGSNNAIPPSEAGELLPGLQQLPGFDNERRSSARWESVRMAYRRSGADSSIAPRAANQCLILGWLGTVVRKPAAPSRF